MSKPMNDGLYEVMRLDLTDAVKHGALVSKLAAELAKELGKDRAFIDKIAMAGMLHDIGKLRLSKYLYGRDEQVLMIEEMKYVRMHATFSYEILKEQGFSEDIQQMVYHHHENYDGSGYPDNMKGEEIPMGARILRCCDVFAALVSKRPYRDAFDVESAVELMIDEVKNFDMEVFLAFQRMLHSAQAEDIYALIEQIKVPYVDEIWDRMFGEIEE
ncbi:MAG: HD domain-containing protein [Lachnospiraceae bacterium]|nr:HD domain-containing protein [Lachnospiraceae bacterium]